MSPNVIGFALLLIGVMMLISKIIRVRWRLAQKLFIPSSILGGGLALLIGPDVFGRIASALGTDRFAEAGLFTPEVLEVWKTLPGLLISLVFAGLLMGHKLPSPRAAFRIAGPQIAFGITVASGQYVFGLLLAILVLGPLFGLPAMAGTLIEIGFEGGHGTAAGMSGTFEEFGFPEGQDLALGLATVGILSGVICGIALINWGVRTGKTAELRSDASPSVSEQAGLVEKERRRSAGTLTVNPSSIEPLTLHFGLLAVAVLIGWLILEALQWIESKLWADSFELFAHVPLFPIAMVGGILVQIAIQAFDRDEIVDVQLIERIQGFSLDVLVIAALGTLSLQAIAANIGPFLLLAGTGLIWTLGAFIFLARRMLPDFWFERGIADVGQAMGVTSTGLILLRVVDPDLKTPAYQAFGYKQLILEPFFGGGLVTAGAIPIIASFGAGWLLAGMLALFLGALSAGLFYFGRQKAPEPQRPAHTSA
ncbi:sodium:glutamate symporter [Nocardia cyriacigeorgica]|uniref:Sodium:glutamate symporter n=1 Tax=Nocardia cyriacigeorgica TaxID=135487 RepID=A0A4U8VUI9_9NOCA|nr:sodium:glutamate symporter [Nocardia cyriacigeorgica]MBF6082864.1 sodium:glutamate symporter [Nocardia cyriacigeorgica]MBF6088618.1 sodium:glutamate symporter [Nocardia cyriacigeorgica]MBF6093210.1 sodium:glutamate symporter [Nocardia cyriacigeorgica]MBF6100194.1 sodium:glutamate symporter [Nocardia cyriacigeorgica]MBF6157361.1 sodium:glutamate symporter [Nocardia cyriacigeorgica]